MRTEEKEVAFWSYRDHTEKECGPMFSNLYVSFSFTSFELFHFSQVVPFLIGAVVIAEKVLQYCITVMDNQSITQIHAISE